MKSDNVNWCVFRHGQVKPELRGRLSCILELPTTPGTPIVRHVFDPLGRDFPACTPQQIDDFLARRCSAIVFEGVSKAAVYDAILSDPVIRRDDPRFEVYNNQLIASACDFFLTPLAPTCSKRALAR